MLLASTSEVFSFLLFDGKASSSLSASSPSCSNETVRFLFPMDGWKISSLKESNRTIEIDP